MNFIIRFLDKKFERKDGKRDYCTASPDVIGGVDIGSFSCRLHDKDYYENKYTRKIADLQFKYNILLQFKIAKKPILGFFVSWVYYLGVRLFGGKSWKN